MAEEVKKSGPFNRKPPDRRFVRQAVGLNRTPHYWTPINLQADECKLLEVKKYSAHYYDIDSKFRRPGIELVSVYIVQNPYLWGQYLLRREQMKLQLKGKQAVRERELFYPTASSRFEEIMRINFSPRMEEDPLSGVPFHCDALSANASYPDNKNVRFMFQAKVLVGTCMEKVEGDDIETSRLTDLLVDTRFDSKRGIFYKFNGCEMYPDLLLVYRDKEIPSDTRSSKINLKYVKKAMRSGTRYNPDEILKVENTDMGEEQGVAIGLEGVATDKGYTAVLQEDQQRCTEEDEPRSTRRKISEMFARKSSRGNKKIEKS